MLFDIKFHFRTGSAHKWLRILQFMCIDGSWTGFELMMKHSESFNRFYWFAEKGSEFFFTLPSSGLGISITDTFDVNCMLAQDQLTSDQRFCSSSVSMIHELAWNYWVDDGTPIIFSRGTSYCFQSGQSSGLSMGGEFDKRESTWHESAFLWALRLLRCCHGGPKQSVRFTPTAKNATPQLQQDTRIWKWAFI